jgi:hypothetical protein
VIIGIKTLGRLAFGALDLGFFNRRCNRSDYALGDLVLQVEDVGVPGTGLVGWRRSADRTCLQPNSLLTGNFTGKFAILGLSDAIS